MSTSRLSGGCSGGTVHYDDDDDDDQDGDEDGVEDEDDDQDGESEIEMRAALLDTKKFVIVY